MRVIIANNGTNIIYDNIASIEDKENELLLLSSPDYIKVTLNGWLIAKTASCRIDKRWLTCVDDVFLDTRVEGV
jgi:hypothetical protein